MGMRTETTIRYGLRDKATGRMLRIEAYDNDEGDAAGAERVNLTLKDYEGITHPYLVEDLIDLVHTVSSDRHWYATSRERPSRSGHDETNVVPVAVETVEEYDDKGGDPISVVRRVRAIDLPLRYKGSVGRTRNDIPDDLLLATFGEAFAAIQRTQSLEWPDAIYSTTVLLDAREMPEIDMLLPTPDRHTGQVDAIAAVPAEWRDHRDYRIDRSNPNLRVALVRINHYRPAGKIRDFVAEDFEMESPSGPRP